MVLTNESVILEISRLSLDYFTLDVLRLNHPAWRLLRSDHAPLIASFLQRVFITPNVRVMNQADLAEMLEDELYGLRQRLGAAAFPKSANDYLNDWADTEKGWLRKFYAQSSDEPHFDLMPATEKAIAWLTTLSERSFVGTESRLLTLFELLKQMSEGSETDPLLRIAELQKRRDEIDAEMSRALAGELAMLDDTELKDRFQQFTQLARELLTDFREVEHNFRGLDRRVRERIALWEGAKGELLEEIMGERDMIADSDQGKSFRAFWDFLMSSRRQEELSTLLDHVLSLSPVAELKPDARMRRVHYDWLEAGEHTQRTVAHLSQQLRRFLDDQAWLENRRIMDILHNIEARALTLRDAQPAIALMSIAENSADIELTMEKPLYTPTVKAVFTGLAIDQEEEPVDTAALYTQVVVDRAQLSRHIRHALQDKSQITLRELCELQPLRHGLAELVAYMQLAGDSFKSVIDEEVNDVILWRRSNADGSEHIKQARLPRVIFVR
jgi:flagellar motility protein MotE (MotC chaperone)